MTLQFQREVVKLKANLLELCQTVEKQVEKAVRSFLERDTSLANEIIGSDHKIDLKEVEVEEECLKILALHQPVANDLRFVVATLKINNDLERIGDLAVNIAERAKFLNSKDPVVLDFDFEAMSHKTSLMLKKALDALIKNNLDLTREVMKEDDDVDQFNRNMYDVVYKGIKKNPENAEVLIHYLSISRHLERIADYATNISEDIIYMVEGSIVRHSPEDYIKK